MTMNKRYVLYALAAIMFAGCQTKNVTETERFDASVRKELPFAVDSLRWLDGVDMDSTNLQLVSSILSEKGERRLDFHL